MAVLDFLTASITINGTSCREYAVDVPQTQNVEVIDLENPQLSEIRPVHKKQNPKKVERYVEAVSGSHFEVRTGFSSFFNFGTGNGLAASIYLNGEYGTGTVHGAEHPNHANEFCCHTCRGARLGDRKVRHRFKFARIVTREDVPEDNIQELSIQHKDLGTVQVVFRRVRTSNLHEGRGRVDSSRMDEALEDIPEKVVKGDVISMAASFGDTERISGQSSVYDVEYIDDLPVATFVFKCRSTKDLQLLYVIPRSPTPVPLELRPVDELGLEEARELIRRQQAAAEVTRLRIKHEASEANLNDLRLLKHHRTDDGGGDNGEVEVIASRSKRQRLLPTAEDEVIDLSE